MSSAFYLCLLSLFPPRFPSVCWVPGEYIATVSFFSLGLFNSLEISFNQMGLCCVTESLTGPLFRAQS